MKSSQNPSTSSLETQLTTPSPEALRKELALQEPSQVSLSADEERETTARADALVRKLLSFKAHQTREQDEVRIASETMGMEIQKRAAKHAGLLKQPIKALSQRSADGGDFADALAGLRARITALDPDPSELEPGRFARTLGWIPGVGSPAKRYFSRFEIAHPAAEADVRSAHQGLDQLSRDNLTLEDYQKQIRAMAEKLEQAIRLGQLIDHGLQRERDREVEQDDLRRRFVNDDLLPSLRQRILDLQLQLSVIHQGILTCEVIIRNNQELIRGVNSVLSRIPSALEVAGKVRALELHQAGAPGQLNMGSVKSAFSEILARIEQVSTFRVRARSQMASCLLQLDQISADAERVISRLEKGNQCRPEFKIDVL